MVESRSTEFKESVTNTFLKTASAFANYGTGTVLFGITDDGTEVGIPDAKEQCLAIENKINDAISPTPDFVLETNPRTRVITLTVREGLHKPYLYRSKAYKRAGTSTVEVDHMELTRLILEGQNLAYENTPAHNQDLTFAYLERKLQSSLGIGRLTQDILKTLELVDGDGAFNMAGELLADANGMPGIDIVRFGDSINTLLDRETHEHMSVLEQYDRAISMFRKYYCYEVIEGSERRPVETVPEAAFREAIANGLVHRQWDESAHIRVAMHPDRVEVRSPGGLPHGLSEREYLEGQVSKLRNPVIGNVFFRLRLIERFGTGVLRIKDAYSASATQPAFGVFENSISVTLPVVRESLPISPDEETVYRTVEGRLLPISEVTRASGFGKTKAQKLLRKLADAGYVEIVGTGRGTKYTAR